MAKNCWINAHINPKYSFFIEPGLFARGGAALRGVAPLRIAPASRPEFALSRLFGNR